MEEIIKQEIEIDERVYKALVGYCKKEDTDINHFIKCNLELIGAY